MVMRAMFVTDGIVARTAVRNNGGEQQIDKGVQLTAGLVALTNTSGTLSPEIYVIPPRVLDICTKSRVAQGPYRALRRRNHGSRDSEFSTICLRVVLFGTFSTCAIYKKYFELNIGNSSRPPCATSRAYGLFSMYQFFSRGSSYPLRLHHDQYQLFSSIFSFLTTTSDDWV
jgi:hypothetical protein